MLKILIVDDERPIRMGLKEIINEVEGYEVVGQAPDGLKAVEEISIHQPDVVITDIRMPRMDGKELIKYLNTNYPSIRKIVLSGFEDFDYVRDTMKNGAVDYLLKPVDEKVLIDLLRRIEADIGAEEASRIDNLNLKIKLNESFPYLRDRFVFELISGRQFGKDELVKKLDYFNLNMECEFYYVIIVSINNYNLISSSKGMEEANLVSFTVRNITEESIIKYAKFFSCLNDAELIVVVAVPEADGREREKLIDDILNEIHGNLLKYSRTGFTLCLGDPAGSIFEIKHSYKNTLGALKHRFYSSNHAILKYADVKDQPFERINCEAFYYLFEKYESIFDNCIKTGNTGKLKAFLEDLCVKLRQSKVYPPDAVELFTELHTDIELTILEFKKTVDEIYGQDYSYVKAVELFDTLEDIRVYTDTIYSRIVERIISNTCRKDKKLVEIVKDYVEKYYSKNITLSTMANITYVNPNYFCGVFKDQTGENFVDYLTRVRIEKAKMLLKDIKMKTYEVGQMVGYENPDYFSRVFKKMVGISPSEYRNLNL